MITSNKKILVVDDTISNLDILVELLADYDVIDESCGYNALKLLRQEKVDLILLDINMPDINGYEVCQKIKSDELLKDIPIIFITAETNEESIEKAYDIGGSDYITKPFKSKELLARVKRELKMQELIFNLEKSQNELKILAATDPMTKLYNRRHFTKAAKHILDLAKKDKEDLSLIMVDIDEFKNINDSYGHAVGDDVIIEFAQILLEEQRNSDIVCRFGGEEFVILLPQTNIEGAKIVAEKIREKTASTIVQISDLFVEFTISLGVSSVFVENEQNIEAALRRADEALYEAKNNGKNRLFVK